ncbi:hypothetical protein EGW08_010579 [Elysia chlorotica]|uniref:Uncharacterized protein n=1 Tax=Elysia chlorotica TaxID=188477 RepID=A0A3S1BIN4_ELYCH|nr:hypothetical protein EGW08_010579 [Elysia chlorotica]
MEEVRKLQEKHAELRDEKLQRQRSISREVAELRECQTRSPSPQNSRRVMRDHSPTKRSESNDELERGFRAIDSPKESRERYARDRKYNAHIMKDHKPNYLKTRRSEEVDDEEYSYRGSPRSFSEKHREHRRGDRRQGCHHDERKLSGSRRGMRTREIHSDGERYESNPCSPKARHKHNKYYREMNDLRMSNKSPDTKKRHVKHIDCEESREHAQSRERDRESPRHLDRKGAKHKVKEKPIEEFAERSMKERQRNDKERSNSPKKTSRRRETIRSVGSSVDSPRSTKTKQKGVEAADDSVSKSHPEVSSEVYVGAARKENGHSRSHGVPRVSSKAAPRGESVSDGEGSPVAGSGDIGPLKTKSVRYEQDRQQDPDGEIRSQKNNRRRMRPKSRSDEIRTPKKLEKDRSKSSQVDDPSFFRKIGMASTSVAVPATNIDGKNCSYNRSLDGPCYPEPQLSIPVKHKYPAVSDVARPLLVKWESSNSQQSHQDRSPSQASLDLSPSSSEDTKCSKSSPCCKWAVERSSSMGQRCTDKTDSEKMVTTTLGDRQNENTISNDFNRNKFTEDPLREETTFASGVQPAAILNDSNCTVGKLHNSTPTNRNENVTLEPADSPSCSTSTVKSSIKMVTPNQKQDLLHNYLKERPVPCRRVPVNGNRHGAIPRSNIYNQASVATEEGKEYLSKWIRSRQVTNEDLDGGKSSDFRGSYTTYDDVSSDTSSSSEDLETRSRSKPVSGSSRDESSSNFSSPEKMRTQSLLRARQEMSGTSPEKMRTQSLLRARQEMSGTSPESCERGRAYTSLRRENSFTFAECSGRDRNRPMGKPGGAIQLISPRERGERPESNEESSTTCEGSRGPRRPGVSPGTPQENFRCSSGGSMRSFTVSASLTITDEDDSSGHFSPAGHRVTDLADLQHQQRPTVTNGNGANPPVVPQPRGQRLCRDRQQTAELGACADTPQASGFTVQRSRPDGAHRVGGHGEDMGLHDIGRDGVLSGVGELSGSGGRGLYSLYRPLDNMRTGSFSPIMEESELTGKSCHAVSICLRNSLRMDNYNNRLFFKPENQHLPQK